jgi:hypothetical protein
LFALRAELDAIRFLGAWPMGRLQTERIVEHALAQLELGTDDELELPAEDAPAEADANAGGGEGAAATIFDADWQEAEAVGSAGLTVAAATEDGAAAAHADAQQPEPIGPPEVCMRDRHVASQAAPAERMP